VLAIRRYFAVNVTLPEPVAVKTAMAEDGLFRVAVVASEPTEKASAAV